MFFILLNTWEEHMRHRYFKEYISPEERMDRIARLLLKDIWIQNNQPKELQSADFEIQATPVLQEKGEEKPINLSNSISKNVDSPKYINTKEVIKMLKVSRTTFWRLRKKKKLSCRRIGNLIRYNFSYFSYNIASKT